MQEAEKMKYEREIERVRDELCKWQAVGMSVGVNAAGVPTEESSTQSTDMKEAEIRAKVKANVLIETNITFSRRCTQPLR